MKEFKFLRLHAVLFCSVVLLTPSPEPVSAQQTTGFPDIDWPLSPQQVRSFFSGSALNLGSDEIEEIFRDILGAASTLLISDYLQIQTVNTGGRLSTECNGDSCEVRIYSNEPGETVTLSDALNDALLETQSVMIYESVSLAQGRGRDSEDGVIFEVLSYGGWQDYHVFAAQAAYVPSVDNFEQILIHSYSIGSSTGTNPVSGSGTWRGVMVGKEAYRRREDDRLIHRFLQGDAELNLYFDLAKLEAEVSFTNIKYLDTGDILDDMSWTQLRVEDGRFRHGVSDGGGGMVDGYFYGPNHEEAGGIFERGFIVGAFGAERAQGPSLFPRFRGIRWPECCRDSSLEFREGAVALDLTPTEISKIYDDLDVLVADPAVFDNYLPYNSDAESQSLWTDRGISFAQWRYGNEDGDNGTLIGYGGWLEYNFFGIDVDDLAGAGSQPIPRPYSFGIASGSNPTAQGGSGTWEGAYVGFYEQPFVGNVVPKSSGSAIITISDFLNPSVDVTLSGVVHWLGIPLMDGSFERVDALGEIEGIFYGPNHEEVGGTFRYERYHFDRLDGTMYGAFGASRN